MSFSVDISAWINSALYLQKSAEVPLSGFKRLYWMFDIFVVVSYNLKNKIASISLSWKVEQKRRKDAKLSIVRSAVDDYMYQANGCQNLLFLLSEPIALARS